MNRPGASAGIGRDFRRSKTPCGHGLSRVELVGGITSERLRSQQRTLHCSALETEAKMLLSFALLGLFQINEPSGLFVLGSLVQRVESSSEQLKSLVRLSAEWLICSGSKDANIG